MDKSEQIEIKVIEWPDVEIWCDASMRWAQQIAKLYEVAKTLTPEDRQRFEVELRGGDTLAQTVADEIRRYKSGKWGTKAAHQEAVARLQEHEKWRRQWKPLPGPRGG